MRRIRPKLDRPSARDRRSTHAGRHAQSQENKPIRSATLWEREESLHCRARDEAEQAELSIAALTVQKIKNRNINLVREIACVGLVRAVRFKGRSRTESE
jgi:hypothetical protein